MRASIGFAVVIAAAVWTGTATAAPCYVIYDRNDAVVYRDLVPPFDLSETNSPARAALRARGQHLLIAEFDDCFAVGYISSRTGGTTATVDEIVARLKPAIDSSVGQPYNAGAMPSSIRY